MGPVPVPLKRSWPNHPSRTTGKNQPPRLLPRKRILGLPPHRRILGRLPRKRILGLPPHRPILGLPPRRRILIPPRLASSALTLLLNPRPRHQHQYRHTSLLKGLPLLLPKHRPSSRSARACHHPVPVELESRRLHYALSTETTRNHHPRHAAPWTSSPLVPMRRSSRCTIYAC